METKILGENIRKYRKKMGITQAEFAEKIGKSANYAGMLERGEKTPSLNTFILIVNALGVSADMLLVDITNNSYKVKNSLLNEKMTMLNSKNQSLVYEVIEVFLKNNDN